MQMKHDYSFPYMSKQIRLYSTEIDINLYAFSFIILRLICSTVIFQKVIFIEIFN